jgi:putative ABC transport system ATP-binding protein
MALFQALNDDGVTLMIVTHEDEVAAFCKRAITLKDGQIVGDVPIQQRRAVLSTPGAAP